MASLKKREPANYENIVDNTKVVKINVEHELKKSFISYAMAVNVSRAIPDARDGLKPVHRRILYAMNELGLTSDKPYRKCALIVGDVLGKYHPHGDSSVYDALVRLAQDFSIRCPLIDGHGNFGSVDGDPAAAYRYTEARMSKVANEMIRDIDKKVVDFYPNFDDTREQPVVLPARYPNLLVNGSDGIAVGMATSIPPHNLTEVINATIALLDNPELTSDDLMEYVPAPDFPTGALILGRNSVKEAYRTGRGSVVMRARTEIEEHNGRDRIIVTELPYQVNKAKLIESIAQLVKDKRIEGIADVQEESDRKGMRIVIDVKRDANAQVVLNMLFKHTNMQVSMGINFLALVKGTPKTLTLREMLEVYVEHQKDVIVRRTQFDLEKAKEREHILSGLVTALANIDEVVALLKRSRDRQDAMNALMERFILSEKQAQAILDMRLQRLTSLEVDKIKEELAEIERMIADFMDILARPERVVQIIKDELSEIRAKYGEDRLSEITYDYTDLDIASMIAREDIVVSLTHAGYVKRIPVKEYHSQKRGGMGVTGHKTREEDFVERIFTTHTHTDQLFFTNFGKVYTLKLPEGYEIPEGERTAKGRAIINLIQVEKDEKVTTFLPLPEGSEGNLVLATRKGYIKKTPLSEFASIRKTGKIAITLTEGDELMAAHITSGDDELLIASSDGKCIRFSERDVRATGRGSQGVKSIDLAEGNFVVDMEVVNKDAMVLTITSNGYGKRTPVEEYRLQNRAGKGIKAGDLTEKTGKLVNLKFISEDEDVMLIADNGIIIRFKASDVSEFGRATQGVRLMKLKEGFHVVCAAITPHEDVDYDENAGENGESQENTEVTSETNGEVVEA